MAEKTIEEYARELMQMYNSVRARTPQAQPAFEDEVGGLAVNVTTLDRLYPVKGADLTVFTGNYDNMTVMETDVSDESGKSGVFKLKAPAKSLSESAGAPQLPYSLYNLSVKADGYIEQIHLNIPVFPGVVSVQGVDLLPVSAAGEDKSARVFDEAQEYTL